jgi:hypothetical protein
MKKLITTLTFAFIAAYPFADFGQADIEKDPAYLPIDKVLDLKANPPSVNVNLPRFLLKDVVSNLNTSNELAKSGIDLADLLKDVKLIRVVVFEGSKSNKKELGEAMKKLMAETDSKWTSIARVHDGGDNVGVYAMGDPSGESMAGVAVLVQDGDEGDTVIVNVVGRVSIGKLMQAASKSNKLPKDLLKQLGFAPQPGEKPAAKALKNGDVGSTNAPIEAPQAAAAKDSDKKY